MIDEAQKDVEEKPDIDIKLGLRPTLKPKFGAKMTGPEFAKMMTELRQKYGDNAKITDVMIKEYMAKAGKQDAQK